MTRSLSNPSRVSTLALAIALVAGPTPAAAQSFEAAGAFTNPAHGTISTDTNTTTITVNNSQSVINWTPNDNGVGGGGINFQPSGTTATFQNNPDLVTDFAVLNRINVADNSRVIALNGTIQSLVNGQTGGAIYFYSPSGFVIGANSVINVGSLVLSASPIGFDPDSGTFIDTVNDEPQVVFGQAENPAAAITTVAGSQISALNEGSYVAMVAPRVGHGGTINVNGVAALVGAEAATITFRTSGLFDITVDVGTTDSSGVGTNGVITGPASTGSGDNHRIFMVAVPKNTALAMVIGGGASLGFDIAGAAEVIDNAVVLSAGHDIEFGNSSEAPSAASGADADISIARSTFTSALYARANGDALASAVDETIDFLSDVSFRGRDLARIEANGSGVVNVGGDVGGNLTMSANDTAANDGEDASAGNVVLQAFAGGTINVAGDTNLTAIGTGGFSSTLGLASGDGTGGTILVQSTTGGTVNLGGDLRADASGIGGSFNGLVDGGDGFGGTVNVFTSGGSSMTVTGAALLNASGEAGSPADCSECGAVGGVGDAGTVNVQAHTGPDNIMTFEDVLYIWADGLGGDGLTAGGLGLGGDVSFSSSTGSTVNVASDVSISASGFGGRTDGIGGVGGNGIGGDVQAFAEGGTLSLAADLFESVEGYGGDSLQGDGGNGTGGRGQAFALANGSLTVTGFSGINTSGYGGYGAINGGDGIGGAPANGGGAYFSANTGGTLTLSSFAALTAEGIGGFGGLGDGGLGQGGHVESYANNALVAYGNSLSLDAEGEGGGASGLGFTSGAGIGGDVYLQAVQGGTLTVAQSLSANAEGLGGTTNFGVYSGDGTGGTINIYSRDGNSSLTVTGSANLEADGYAGYSSECSFGCSAGGIGEGGDIFIASTGSVATGVNELDFQSSVYASANGYGGESAVIDFDTNTTVNGGLGLGGSVNVAANGGNSLNVAGELTLEAIGFGGYDSADLVAGDGAGGLVQITSNNVGASLLNFGSTVVLDASGYGGDSGQSANGDGGNGTGGIARVNAFSGTMDFDGELSLYAMGFGGDTFGGAGGDGTGNTARINALGGDINIGGTAYTDASGFGGAGMTGGNGTGGGNPATMTGGARIIAQGSDIVIQGSAVAVSDGTGGDGSFGGGNGGNGSGGWALIHAANSDLGPSSISLEGNIETSAFVSASGMGGDGGEGLQGIDGEGGGTGSNGGDGSDGGNGGTGTGGSVLVTASAGNGTLNIGFVVARALGTGGDGGAGGSGGAGGNGDGGPGGDGGAGGAGGVGGAAIGGFVQVGTESGVAQALGTNLGLGNYGFIELDGSAQGGTGGDGGLGGLAGSGTPNGLVGIDGNGGDGGDADGGTSVLVVRGSTVDVSFAELVANATGGDGGSGVIAGAGGDAESDEAVVIVTGRFENPAQRGTLNAGTIVGTVTSTGGSGSVAGASMMEGGSGFIVENSDATIGSLDFTVTADGQIADIATDSIAIVNGDVTVGGTFSFVTDGVASVHADNGTLTAGSFVVAADNFIHDPERLFPADVGTISADTFDLSTNGDLIIDAHLVSTSSLDLVAPGLIDIEDATSGDNITLDAGGSISGGSVTAANLVDAIAGGDIGLNIVNAGTNITMLSTGGSILSNGMSAGGLVDLHSAIDVSIGDIAAGDSITILSDDGDVGTGDLSAGFFVDVDAPGDINLGDVQAYVVDLDAGGSISGGNIDSETDITAVAGADIDLLDLVAGGITIEGFQEGNVALTAGGGINSGSIDAFGSVVADAGGSIAMGDIDASTFVDLLAGANIGTGDIFAFDAVTANAVGSITTGDIGAATIDLFAGNDITTGDLSTQASLLLGGDIVALLFPGASVTLEAGGDISTGDIASIDGVYASAGGGISTGAIDAQDFVQLLAGADILTGPISAGGFIDIFTTGGDIGTGNLSGTNIDLASETGDILFGNVEADILDFEAGGAVTGGNVVATSAALGEAQGAVVLGNISVGPGLPPVDEFSVGLASATSITVGDVSGADRVGFATFGDLVTGDLTAGTLIMALVGGDISIGSMTTTGLNGEIFMADAQMYIDAGGLEDDFDPNLVFVADIIPTGGSVTINGPVDSTFMTIAAGGLLSLNGDVTVDASSLMSGDIALGSGVTVSGFTSLYSINGQGTFVGDGLTGPGYMLSNAEYNAFQDVSMEVRPDYGAAASLILGDLDIGSAITEAAFAIEDADDNDLGTIRVVGDVRMNNAAGELFFESETFQIDAATGSINISADGTTPGGELIIAANNIHVAEGAILDRLAADPQYDGYIDDLNDPASTQRPDGVIRAAIVTLEFGDTPADLYTLYVQNMGTADGPSGFFITDLDLGDGEVDLPPGSLDMVISGRILTPTGTLSGIAVRDLLVANRNLTPFTSNSTINGCLLVGICGTVEPPPPPEPPIPPNFQPAPGIQKEITLIKDNLLGPPEFGNEDFIDDNDEATDEGATSPIEPPQPLFDTSGLGGKGDIDDPVSGSGNPSLMETPPSSEEKPQ